LVFTDCARIGSPAGGPMDEKPPEIKKSTPLNYSTQFDKKNIEIQFDEYIRLDDINQKLIISPPLNTRPQIRTKGKSIQITIDDTLISNTTYTFNFNDAIVDNNEGNPLENYQFVFSTGDALDSLILSGRVIQAFDNEIPKNVIVVLYEDLSDSAIFKAQPLFLTKLNEKGQFLLRNLKSGSYQLYALQDENANYTYDPPEMVAFSDSIVRLNPEYSAYLSVDDTSSRISMDSIHMFLFSETLSEQYLKTSERPRKEYFQLVFNIPPISLPIIEMVDHPSDSWFIDEQFVIGDTIGFWVTDTSLIAKDVLDIAIQYPIQKIENETIFESDTIRLRYSAPKRSRRRPNTEISEEIETLELTIYAGSGFQLDLEKNILIETKTPLNSFISEKMHLISIVDSIRQEEAFTLLKDTNQIRKMILSHDWKAGAKYELEVLPGAITDIYDRTNDTVHFSFGVRERDFYGNIILVLESIDKPLIIQLLDEKEKILKTTSTNSDTTIYFRLLHPRNYRIKAIWDANQNDRWDTGNILEHIQPEKVEYYEELIKLRSNWDFEKNWSPRFNKN